MNPNKKIALSEIRNTIGRSGAIALALVLTTTGSEAGHAAYRAFALNQAKAGIVLTVVAVFSVGAGLVLLLLGYAPIDARRLASERKEMELPQPWMWRDDWAKGRIPSAGKGAMVRSWGNALVWNVTFCGVMIVLFQEMHGSFRILLELLPAIGVVFFGYAVLNTVRWMKFGQSSFKMLSVPGSVGGSLSGAIETSVKINPKDGFHLKLRCIRCEGSSAGKKTGVFDGVLWEDKTTLLNELPGDDPRRSIIPVFFRIPGDCHPTDDTSASEQIIWYLETRAKLPGVDYCEWFEVPVFRMAGNPPSSRVAAPTLHYQATGQSHEQPVRSRVHARDLPGGAREFVIPPLGNPGIAGLLVAGAVVFSALAWFTTGADREFVFFPILLGALGLALLLAALVTAFKSIRVTADATGLVLLSRWVFFRRTRHLSADEISEIAVAVGLTVGNNAYYDLRLFAGGVRTARGRWLTIVRSIRNKQEAEWLAQELSRSLRLDKVSPALTISR